MRHVQRNTIPVAADSLLHWSVREGARILGELAPERAALVMIKHYKPGVGRVAYAGRLKMSLHGWHVVVDLPLDHITEQSIALIHSAAAELLRIAKPYGPQPDSDEE